MATGNNPIHNCMLLNKHLTTYPGEFDKYQERYLKNSIGIGPTDRNLDNDLTREMLDELGMIPDDRNLYLDFMKLIEEIHPDFRDKTIVEIGSGILPRLGERISKQMQNGRIILFDPLISKYKQDTDKMTIVRDKAKVHDKTFNWGEVDLFVALKPCGGANDLLDIVRVYGTDFILGLCEGGPHGDEFDFYESDDEWIDSTIFYAERKVEEKGMGQLVKTRLDKPYYSYPIIYNRRNKDNEVK